MNYEEVDYIEIEKRSLCKAQGDAAFNAFDSLIVNYRTLEAAGLTPVCILFPLTGIYVVASRENIENKLH